MKLIPDGARCSCGVVVLQTGLSKVEIQQYGWLIACPRIEQVVYEERSEYSLPNSWSSVNPKLATLFCRDL
jgi:hypothetical protein